MPRTFTHHELRTFTLREIASLSEEDTEAFHKQWLAMAANLTAEAEGLYLSGDLDRVDSRRRYEDGE